MQSKKPWFPKIGDVAPKEMLERLEEVRLCALASTSWYSRTEYRVQKSLRLHPDFRLVPHLYGKVIRYSFITVTPDNVKYDAIAYTWDTQQPSNQSAHKQPSLNSQSLGDIRIIL